MTRALVLACLILTTVNAAAVEGLDRAAFIDADATPLGALLEAKLLETPKVEWVERNDLQTLLGERELTLAFAADAAQERANLGQLLKARVLVLLRRVTDSDNYEFIVCETRQGLRILGRRLKIAEATDERATELAALARDAISQALSPQLRIVAVPPFFSEDLAHTHDGDKQTYARMLEAHLQDRGDVIVVEIAEARAIAKEIGLADPGGTVTRELPLYVLGSYHNHSEAGVRRVSLVTEIKQGERSLTKTTIGPLPPAEAPRALMKQLDRALVELGFQEARGSSPQVEASEALQRARQFQKIGDLTECVALLEVALSLDPENLEVRETAVDAFAAHYSELAHTPSLDRAQARLAVDYLRRGCELYELVLRDHLRLKNDFRRRFFQGDGLARGYDFRSDHVAPAARSELVAASNALREAMLRIIPLRAEFNPTNSPNFVIAALQGLNYDQHLSESAAAEMNSVLMRAMESVRHLPNAKTLSSRFVSNSYTLSRIKTPEAQALLARMRESQIEVLRRAADEVERQAEAFFAREERRKAEQADSAPVAERRSLELQPIDLRFPGPRKKFFHATVPKIYGLLKLNDATDLFWGDAVGLLARNGEPEYLWIASQQTSAGTRACFDGQFAWVIVEYASRHSSLFVVDPAAKRIRELSDADGLPLNQEPDVRNPIYTQLAVTSIGNGSVCVAGSFGRGWIANARLASFDAKLDIDIFHVARDFGRATDPAKITPDMRFRPNWMHVVWKEANATSEPYVLLGTMPTGFSSTSISPFLIRPDLRSVSRLDVVMRGVELRETHATTGTAVLSIEPTRGGRPLGLVRFTAPDFKRDVLLNPPRDGLVFVEPGRLHVIGNEWWSVGFDGSAVSNRKMTLVADDLPWQFFENYPPRGAASVGKGKHFRIYSACASAHYGLVLTDLNGSPPLAPKTWPIEVPE